MCLWLSNRWWLSFPRWKGWLCMFSKQNMWVMRYPLKKLAYMAPLGIHFWFAGLNSRSKSTIRCRRWPAMGFTSSVPADIAEWWSPDRYVWGWSGSSRCITLLSRCDESLWHSLISIAPDTMVLGWHALSFRWWASIGICLHGLDHQHI